ncbi:phage baseplate protein [Listeria fleischmannii]|uniref:Dit-like phage tail protein N-terminal domain-containing protein n=1 Tax=Listeria fleischmannii FSL S10-1203 TaxID=1265822 RepID=W7DFC9_9LIST|nr:hypothetical protein [Listeria fleischmannii]EUJ44033.1 hypothetical protein MCOL2_20101 [Listeria fleischmannii FSL S10-1203]
MATLGAVKLVNTREDEAVPVEVTNYPVEVGAAITDHVQQQNKTLSVTGFLLGKTAEQDYKKLRDYAQKGTIISYKGRVYYSSILISQVTKGYDTIENGMEITVSITTLRRATTPWVQKKKNIRR